MNPITQDSVVVNRVRSPYLQSGDPSSDEAVVFVHGNPGSGKDWRDLLARVGQFGRAVALDMPGFGQADKPDNFEYTVAGYACHLAGALTELGISRVHLVLHDFGGPWGIAWAVENPNHFASVTFINTGILAGYRWHYLANIWRTPVIGEIFMATTTRAGFHLLLKHGNPHGLPKTFVNQMFDDFDWGTRRAVLKLYRVTDPGAPDEMTSYLPSPPRPALVVWGTHDPYIPVRFADEQKRFFPGAKVVKLEQSGHWPYADNPEEVAGIVVPFLRQQLSMDNFIYGEP